MHRLHHGRAVEEVALPLTAERLLPHGQGAVVESCSLMEVRPRHPGPEAGVEESHLLMAELPLRHGLAVADSRPMVERLLRHGREEAEGSSDSLKSLFA